MSAIEERAARDLFPAPEDAEAAQPTVTVKYIELAGKKALDLLGRKAGAAVKIVDELPPNTMIGAGVDKYMEGEYESAGDGEAGEERVLDIVRRINSNTNEEKEEQPKIKVAWRNATELTVTSAEQLLKFIAVGKSRRATEATDVNGTSSRSHAVLQVTVTPPPGATGEEETKGVLTLIDCAGSERRNDSMYHSKERQAESAEINASLYALKECIRARVLAREKKKPGFIPYRSSLLTRVLRESFEDPAALFSIIATAAPTATDTEHTMETLKTVSSIVGLEDRIEQGENVEVKQAHLVRQSQVERIGAGGTLVMPGKWKPEQLREWLAKSNGGLFAGAAQRLKKDDGGKMIMGLTAAKLAGENGLVPGNKGLATELYNKLREESDRMAKKINNARQSNIAARKGLDVT
jgi:kinesin family protein 2/24